MEQTPEKELLVERRKDLGVITLNRPRAVNALSPQMLRDFHEALRRFEVEDVQAALITSRDGRGLCAGGDIVHIYRTLDGDPQACWDYPYQEYTLNYRLATFPKPTISVMDGLVLGGGMGISAYATYRIVTERTRLGMPEAVIGFSPDVGMARMLAASPHQLGTLLALTGLHIPAQDALATGLADHYLPSETLPDFERALENSRDIPALIRAYEAPAPASELLENAAWIEQVFAAPSLEEIMDGVRRQAAQGSEFAGRVLAALEHNSPTGMKVALEAILRASQQILEETLEQDYRLIINAMRGHDLREGIRAQVIDKDRQPRWKPATPQEVSPQQVAAFFEPYPPAGNLGLVAP